MSSNVMITDGQGNPVLGVPYPVGATPVLATALTGGNTSITATLPAAVGKTTYITGFTVSYVGNTAGTASLVTVSGLLGGVTASYLIPVPPIASWWQTVPLTIPFNPAFPASATNTSIAVNVPALGVGNFGATLTVQGYQL